MYQPENHNLLKGILRTQGIRDLDLELRLSANLSRIRGLFDQIYGGRKDCSKFFELLIKSLIQNSRNRPNDLKESDLDREKNPTWFLSPEIAGMSLYVDKFAGNLLGFIEHLDYLEKLGINLVHLMPLMNFPDEKNDGGYAVSDFRSVKPSLGDMEDIARIGRTFREKSMYLMLDLAINHTSEDHDWAVRARGGEKKYQEYYYCFDDRKIPDQYDENMPWVFPGNAPGNFTFITEMNKWVMTVFHDYQWDLNYTNPQVFLEMLDNLLFLANNGVDIIRLDALAFTWKEIGTTSQNLEKAHLLMQLFKSCTQIVAPGVLFLAEAIVAPNDIVRYFGQPQNGNNNECDMAYNATLMTLIWESVATRSSKLLHKSFDNIPSKPDGTTWLNYIRCHDDIGLGYEDLHAQWAGYDGYAHRVFLIDFLGGKHEMSFSKGDTFMRKATNDARISGALASLIGLEKAVEENNAHEIELALKRIQLVHAIILSYGGIPMLYMGDELGLINDYSYQNDPKRQSDNRWMHRPTMDWKKAKDTRKKGSIEGRIFSSVQNLLAIRKKSPEFTDLNNTWRIQTENDHLFIYLKAKDGFKTLCVYNLDDHRQLLGSQILEQHGFDISNNLTDRITGKGLNFRGGQLFLEPHESLWLSNITEK